MNEASRDVSREALARVWMPGHLPRSSVVSFQRFGVVMSPRGLGECPKKPEREML